MGDRTSTITSACRCSSPARRRALKAGCSPRAGRHAAANVMLSVLQKVGVDDIKRSATVLPRSI
jgi:hypothetical protein